MTAPLAKLRHLGGVRALQRIVAIAFVLQFSGALHAVIDYASNCARRSADSDDNCTDGCGGTSCAPGCLGCHHPHTNILVARLDPQESVSPVGNSESLDGDKAAPLSPAQRQLFRPPRSPLV